MITSKRPTLESLMRSLNSERWPERWNDIYDSVMDDYEKNGLKLLNPDYYDELAEKYNMIPEYREDYKRVASEIAKDDALSRLLAMMAASMRDRANIKADIKQLELPKSPDGSYVEKYDMLPALVMCETADYTYSLIKDRNLPEEHFVYAMRRCDGNAMVAGYARRNEGRLGAINWGWFQLGVDAKLFKTKLLVLELGKKFTKRATVFENKSGELVTIAHDAVFHRDGYILGTKNYEDSEGSFELVLEETDDAWIGCPYNERGLATKEKTVLSKSEWKKVLSPDDPVVSLHIPSGERLTDQIITESFAEAREFLAKYFPEQEYKAFVCTSWLLDPQIADLLGPDGNIAKFGKRFHRITHKDSGNSVFSFVFLQNDVNNVNLDKLSENTSLERALKKHYLEGNRIYDTFGYILK